MKFCSFLLVTFIGHLTYAQSPEELANQQLEAYNDRDIDAFLIPYSDSVKVFDASGKLLYQGKETMRNQYGAMFERTSELNCNLLNRITVNETVIEHEEVTFGGGRKVYAIVMYKVANDKIQEVYFLDRKNGN